MQSCSGAPRHSGAGDRTNNLSVTSQPALPPELVSPHTRSGHKDDPTGISLAAGSSGMGRPTTFFLKFFCSIAMVLSRSSSSCWALRGSTEHLPLHTFHIMFITTPGKCIDSTHDNPDQVPTMQDTSFYNLSESCMKRHLGSNPEPFPRHYTFLPPIYLHPKKMLCLPIYHYLHFGFQPLKGE